MDRINFYKTNEAFGFLSNFAPFTIFVDGLVWPTTEHYYQASKFEDEEIKNRIRSIKSPMKAAEEGRRRKNPIRKDWNQIRDGVMRIALRSKFFQHPDIRIKLLETGESILVEHTTNDIYWGDGGDGSGQNKLGLLLMEVRESLKQVCSNPNWMLPPWIAFPDIDPIDMFWRMGIGETYVYSWVSWYNSVDSGTKLEYRKFFPSPFDWVDFYN